MLEPQKQLELDTLLHKLVDGDIGPFEFQRLNDMLMHDREAQRHYLHHADMVNTIRWQLIGESTQQSIAALKTMRDTAPMPSADAIPERPARRRIALRIPSINVRYAAAAAIVLGVTLVGMLIAPHLRTAQRIATTKDLVLPVPPSISDGVEPQVALVPKVEQRAGNVQVSNQGDNGNHDDNARDVEVAADIQPGQTIKTRGGESSTVLRYEDATNIVLGNDTTFTVEKASYKKITLDGGSLAADVSPQPPSKPMHIITPHAEIQVVGTRFSVETEPDRTKLSVTEGKVRIRLVQQPDGRWHEVPAGNYALAEPIKNTVSIAAIPKLPETWVEDFEQGLPAGWQTGKLVNDGCCNKGWKSVRAASDVHGFYQIKTHLKRSEGEGLFQVQPDTHVHLLLRVSKPGAVNLYLSTRPAGPIPDWGNFIFANLDHHVKKDLWYEVIIPIHQFQRDRGEIGEHPQPNDIPFQITLGTFNVDRGLTLDKIWVTQSGPGVVKSYHRK